MAFTSRYVIPGVGREQGRLYVQGQPSVQAVTPDAPPEPVYLLQMFARCPAHDSEATTVPGLLDLAHHWVVNGFTSLTTTTMHTAWGKRER